MLTVICNDTNSNLCFGQTFHTLSFNLKRIYDNPVTSNKDTYLKSDRTCSFIIFFILILIHVIFAKQRVRQIS